MALADLNPLIGTAIKVVRDESEVEWKRINGLDWCNEESVKKMVKAARVLADYIDPPSPIRAQGETGE